MPPWVSEGTEEYCKRLPNELTIHWHEIPIGQRGKQQKNLDIKRIVAKEGEQMLKSVQPQDHVIALDVTGKPLSTEKLAHNLKEWQLAGQNISLLIGGPDGLSPACIDRANARWSLSQLTLPHPLVRVVLAEQLYRAWSINAGHPYHR